MLKTLLEYITIGYVAICVLTLIYYLPRLKCWFSPFRKQPVIHNDKKNRFAILVPARNESKVINSLFESFKGQTYDRNYFDVHIIVKEENDPTIALANKEPNTFCHVVSTQNCKGDALDGAIKDIIANQPNYYDAFVIVDADCLLAPTFIEEMNNAMASGKQVIQAKKIVKNYLGDHTPLSAACNGLIWPLMDDLGNRYKSDHNITIMTIGTGILIRSDVIKELGGWPYRQTLTEDIEFMYDCAINHFSTFYYSHARIYVEEASTLHVTNKRRTRWLTGVVDSKRIYNDQIKRLNITKEEKKNKYYTTALSPVYLFVGTNTIFSIFNLVTALVLFLLHDSTYIMALNLGIFSFLVIYVSFFFLTIFCMLVDRKEIKLPFYKKLLLLFVHPLFYMGYIPIISKALFLRTNRGWEVIERIDFVQDHVAQ